MSWRYRFDTGPEKPLACDATIYVLAAMSAFSAERVEKIPLIKGPGTYAYDGHVLTLWRTELLPDYGPYHYGIGLNDCGSLTIVTLVNVVAGR